MKSLGRYDAEGREVRVVDRLEYLTWLIIVGCIVGMAIWVHSIADNVTGVGHRLHNEQLSLNAEAVTIGAERVQLINGCARLNRVLVSINTASAGNYTLFHFIFKAVTPKTHGYRQVEAATASQSWTPKTNCERLVNAEGSRYHLPAAVPFTQRQPPKSELLQPHKPVLPKR